MASDFGDPYAHWTDWVVILILLLITLYACW